MTASRIPKTPAMVQYSRMKAEYPDVNFDMYLQSVEYLDTPNHESWVPDYNRQIDAMNTAYDLVASGENTNVQEVLDNLAAECQGYIDEWWELYG